MPALVALQPAGRGRGVASGLEWPSRSAGTPPATRTAVRRTEPAHRLVQGRESVTSSTPSPTLGPSRLHSNRQAPTPESEPSGEAFPAVEVLQPLPQAVPGATASGKPALRSGSRGRRVAFRPASTLKEQVSFHVASPPVKVNRVNAIRRNAAAQAAAKAAGRPRSAVRFSPRRGRSNWNRAPTAMAPAVTMILTGEQLPRPAGVNTAPDEAASADVDTSGGHSAIADPSVDPGHEADVPGAEPATPPPVDEVDSHAAAARAATPGSEDRVRELPTDPPSELGQRSALGPPHNADSDGSGVSAALSLALSVGAGGGAYDDGLDLEAASGLSPHQPGAGTALAAEADAAAEDTAALLRRTRTPTSSPTSPALVEAKATMPPVTTPPATTRRLLHAPAGSPGIGGIASPTPAYSPPSTPRSGRLPGMPATAHRKRDRLLGRAPDRLSRESPPHSVCSAVGDGGTAAERSAAAMVRAEAAKRGGLPRLSPLRVPLRPVLLGLTAGLGKAVPMSPGTAEERGISCGGLATEQLEGWGRLRGVSARRMRAEHPDMPYSVPLPVPA